MRVGHDGDSDSLTLLEVLGPRNHTAQAAASAKWARMLRVSMVSELLFLAQDWVLNAAVLGKSDCSLLPGL